ncbi:MAG: hypothetical protein MZV63_60490 [Marinilabiliales bacterium]|nr:hypothetical protein [Marinilabiliales bacterium]
MLAPNGPADRPHQAAQQCAQARAAWRTRGNIAYVLCAGSRGFQPGELSHLRPGHQPTIPICAQVCCVYSLKRAQLLMGALPNGGLITIYYMDIRAFRQGVRGVLPAVQSPWASAWSRAKWPGYSGRGWTTVVT